MRPIRFEAANSPVRTNIGESLTKVAIQTGRLETGHAEDKYILRHDDGCAVCGVTVVPGGPTTSDRRPRAATDDANRMG